MGKLANGIANIQKAFKAYLANQDLKDLTAYMAFVFVFSFVTFSGKPAGQYELTQMALQKYATCDNEGAPDYCEIEDEESLYGWLAEEFSGIAFPQESYDGTIFDRVTKLFILGQSRFMGAMRMRQIRTVLDECEKVPSWLTDVPNNGPEGTITLNCTQEIGGDTEMKTPFGNPEELHNFTRPFTWQSTSELNTTSLGMANGEFDSYPQSGYTLDIVPNLASSWFAEKVQACMPLLQAAIEACMVEQGVSHDAEVFDSPPPPSPPGVPPPTGDRPGIKLTSFYEGAESDRSATELWSDQAGWATTLEYDFFISDDNLTLDYVYNLQVHQTSTKMELLWVVQDLNSITGATSWLVEVDPSSGELEKLDGECAAADYNCDQAEAVKVKVKVDTADFEARRQVAIAQGVTSLPATQSNATLMFKCSPCDDTYNNIWARLKLTMTYVFNTTAADASSRHLLAVGDGAKRVTTSRRFNTMNTLMRRRRRRLLEEEASKPAYLRSARQRAKDRHKDEEGLDIDWRPPPESKRTTRRLQQSTEADEENTCVEKEENDGKQMKYPSTLETDACVMTADPFNTCELDYMGFQLLLDYVTDEVCGLCKCTKDPEGDCSSGEDEEIAYGEEESAYAQSTEFVESWDEKTDEEKACYCQANCNPVNLYTAQMEMLMSNRWTDIHTRGIVLDLTVLDQNYNWFTVIRLLMEFPEMGGHAGVQFIYPYQIVSTFRLFRYVTAADVLVLAFEVIFVIFIVTFSASLVVEMKQQKWDFWKDGWHYIDLSNAIIFYAVIMLRTLGLLLISKFDFDSITVEYVDFPPLAVIATAELNIGAFNFFLMYFKFFKYLGKIPRMDSILVTVSNAAFDLFLFSIMFFIVTYSFAAAFYIVFSADVEEFSTLLKCFTTLLNYLLGDFDYYSLYEVNPILGPVLFYLYNFLVFFILLNMFLAIIADSYAEVKGNQTEEDLKFYYNLRDTVMSNMQVLFKKKETVHELAQELMRADGDLDDMIDEAELEKALAANPAAYSILKVSGAKELLQKYDVSGDGVLDKSEMTEILRELAEKEAEIQAEMDIAKGELDAVADKVEEEGGDMDEGLHGGMMNFSGPITVDTSELEQRIDKVEGQIKEMSRNVAKKLSLMIDLMMSLSDQVSSVSSMPAGGNQQIMPVVR